MPAIFRMKFDSIPEWGEVGVFELTKLTRAQLSQFKHWYGDEYGQRVSVMTKTIFEDTDAVGCIVWACRKENGLTVRGPKEGMPDFDPEEVFVPRPEDSCPTCNGTGKVPHEDDEAEVPLDRTENPSANNVEPSTPTGETAETLTSSGGPGSPASSPISTLDQPS